MSSLASRAHGFNWQNASKGNSSPRPSFRANELYVCLSSSLPFPVTHTCPVCRVRRLDQGRCLKGVVCGPKSARGGNVSCPLFWLFDEHFPRPAIAGSMCFRDITLSNSPTHEIDTLIPTLLMGKRWPMWLKWLSLVTCLAGGKAGFEPGGLTLGAMVFHPCYNSTVFHIN